ncbi:SemiSWEET family sugar transporter [Reichenbachiella ulvae]|uniref:SemiSWEET transporter n=1 Tax=Reichenbachiella ulvae TaxID=2980104 RepID=A0ABT3CPM7_9BACT|nr:SemiSWEET transporter [Reichenbachiella ulvae]MCV9385641.1 SemiSWEET transporter [Reichenbachiella ulvae]
MDITNIVGMIAALLTTISFVPQALKTIRTKHTGDLSLNMYIALNTGVALWFVYGLIQNAMPIILANSITFCFTFTILVMIIKYRDKPSAK